MADTDATATAPEAKEEEKPEISNVVDTLSDGTLVRRRVPRQRACNMPKGKKICAGHLKRWYEAGVDVHSKFGDEVEVYRCEHCQTLYLPAEDETPRTGTLSY